MSSSSIAGLPRVLLSDLTFAEGPRWHDGRLWFSDMFAPGVVALDPANGRADVIVNVPGRPSGIGWDPAGRMHVVSMVDRLLLRETAPGSRDLVVHADLASLQPHECNDMVVDIVGRAYVGGFGFDLNARATPRPTVLIAVEPDGVGRIVADELQFPNGLVLLDEGRTLVVAETFGRRLTAFDVDSRGDLSGRRTWAHLPDGVIPDGICGDALGNIWTTSPSTYEVLLIAPGGDVVDRRPTGQRRAMACMLGGHDRRTLFLCTATRADAARCAEERGGRIEAIDVAVPGAGLP